MEAAEACGSIAEIRDEECVRFRELDQKYGAERCITSSVTLRKFFAKIEIVGIDFKFLVRF